MAPSSPSILDNPFQVVHSTSALYTINIRSFFLQKRDRIVFLSLVIILLTVLLPLSHDVYYENSFLSNTVYCNSITNDTSTNRKIQVFATDEWSNEIIQYNSYVANHPFIKNGDYSTYFPQVLEMIPKIYLILFEHIIKFACYMFLLMMYWRFHNIMNKLFKYLLLNETIEMENEKTSKQTTTSTGSHHLFLLCSEISRCLISSIWIVSVQMLLGRFAPAYLWILVYSCLGSVALEMSKKPAIDQSNKQLASSAQQLLPAVVDTSLWKRTIHWLRELAATHATTYTTITGMVLCEMFVMIYYLNYSFSFCSCVATSILIVQVMTIELIDFMRNHSIEFVQQREVQSMKRMANLYKNMYMSAPDTFLSCVCDSEDILMRSPKQKIETIYSFLDAFKIMQYNNTAIDTLSCAYSISEQHTQPLHVTTLADVIINPYTESEEVMKTAALGGNVMSATDLQNSAVLKLKEVLQDVIHSSPSSSDQASKQLTNHERILPLFVKGKNQTMLTCSLSVSRILLYDGDVKDGEGIVFFNIILHDITQKYKLLDEINVEKEKAIMANKAKSQFLAQMSHELRTPLHGIIGLTDVLLSKCKDSAEENESICHSTTTTNHLLPKCKDSAEEYTATISSGGGSGNSSTSTTNNSNSIRYNQTISNQLNNLSKDSASLSYEKSLNQHAAMEQQVNIVQTIKYSGNILLGLINDLLDICKIESSKIKLEHKRFNLRRALDQIHCGMFQLQAREKGLEFSLLLGENVPTFVIGDENRLVQILINLVYNAIKFTDQGSVSLIIESNPTETSSLEDGHSFYDITFKVVDTGIGISKNDIKRLFQPFSQINSHKQTKINEGTGLGLYISTQLVEMMGGKLSVESEEGVGSNFYFTIKLQGELDNTASGLSDFETTLSVPFKKLSHYHHGDENDTTDSTVVNDVDGGDVHSYGNVAYIGMEKISNAKTLNDYETYLPNLNILIVEDNAINRIVLINMLKKIGCVNVSVAQDGLEGVQSFEDFKNRNQNYDIVFIDIFMPKLDGYGTVRRLVEIESNDPSNHHSILVALTANGFEETKNYCLEHGFDIFMSKPFSINDLENCMIDCLTRIYPNTSVP